MVVALVVATPAASGAAVEPVGPLSPPSGAWFGGTVNPNPNDGVNGGMAEINARESFLGRTYDIINRFYGFNVAIPTSLENWDVSRGRYPMITWGAPADTIQLRNGTHDAWLRQQADRMAAFNSPIFLRFYHEMEGGYRQSYVHSPADFIAAWRHVHDIFVQRGATNVVWIWSPTAWSFVTRSPWPPDYYPGDAYVDWVAADGYSWFPFQSTPWRSWSTIFQDFYDWAKTKDKPIMIAENAAMEDPDQPGRKAQWITSSQQLIKSIYPRIQAVMYFDNLYTKGGYTYTWQVDTSQSSYNAYRAMGADPYFSPSHGVPDSQPPTTPGTPTGVSNSSSSIDLTWSAATDDVSSTLTYRIFRDGDEVGSLSSASTTTVSFTDSGLAAGSTHSYRVLAEDGWGNPGQQSGQSAPITVLTSPNPTVIFADGFSSGSFSNWTTTARLSISTGVGSPSPPSARAQVVNQSAWAERVLPGTHTAVCMSLRADVASSGNAALVLFRLRTASDGAIARVFLNPAGQLVFRSDISGVQRSSGVALGLGWHQVRLCGAVGAAGSWTLSRDGAPVLSGWVANTGSTPVGRVEIGDTSARTFTANFDDVVVEQAG